MRSQAGELEASPVTLLIEVDRVTPGLTEAYVSSEPSEITKKKNKNKSYYKG